MESLRRHLPVDALRWLGLWAGIALPVGVLSGSASALFLVALDAAGSLRQAHGWLLYLLPLAGPLIVWLHAAAGPAADRGTNRILEEIHAPGPGVPVRLAPLILVTTLLTHLFGGSAGREGTAVQMGGGLAGGFIRLFRVPERHRPTVLLAGIAAGFGSVFGTPVAGAVFALEVLAVGRMRSDALVPCLLAGWVGDRTCTLWGVGHVAYSIAPVAPAAGAGPAALLLVKVVLAGIAFGLAARLFVGAVRAVHGVLARWLARAWMRPVVGGALVIGLAWVAGTRSYLGLGVTSPDPAEVTIVSCFAAGGASAWSWAWKLAFTAVTLGSGFKGGEVTPLFFVGAALGNVLGTALGMPVDLAAGLGFVAVFAAASNTPLACTLMAVELFGAAHAGWFALACGVAWLFSGPAGLYAAQRPGFPKAPEPGPDPR